jgi:hypothetical protein
MMLAPPACDESYSRLVQGLLQPQQGGHVGHCDPGPLLDPLNGCKSYCGSFGEVRLAPAQQRAGGPDLFGIQHANECFRFYGG